MKIVLAALNAKYVHSNLAVYDLESYFRKKHKIDKEKNISKDNEKQIKKENEIDDKVVSKKDIIKEEALTGNDIILEVSEYTINHNMDAILQDLYKKKADVYAFSCYIWNIYEVLSLTNELAKVLPKARIWLGGPEATYGAKKYLEEHSEIEGVMMGEGEEIFAELGEVWKNCNFDMTKNVSENNKIKSADDGEDDCAGDAKDDAKDNAKGDAKDDDVKNSYKGIRGIIYRDSDEKIIENPPASLMNLDDIPFVYYDLERFKNKILYYETSRGCPFSCSYCLSSIDKTVRFRSFELVKGELDFFIENKVPQVKFVDRTFNCSKKHAREIWRYIAEHDNGITNFHFEIAADLIENEDIEIFRTMRRGLIQLEIGLQSTNLKTIDEIKRKMDITSVKETLLKVRSLGNIHQHLDLIAGLPFEDFKSFKTSFNEAMTMKPNQLQLGFLKVLKGSYMGDMADEYEIKYRDVQPYEVLSTKWISYDEIMILKKVEEMVEVYYNSDQFEYTLPYVIGFFDNQFDFYKAFGDYYEDNDLFGIGFKREARYKAFIDFINYCIGYYKNGVNDINNANKIKEINKELCFNFTWFDFDIFMQLLTFDFYLRENAKSRPAWMKDGRVYLKDRTKHAEKISKKTVDIIRNIGDLYVDIVFEIEREVASEIKAGTECKGKDEVNNKMENDTKKGDAGIEIIPDEMVAIFDYNNRNKLSNNAAVTLKTVNEN